MCYSPWIKYYAVSGSLIPCLGLVSYTASQVNPSASTFLCMQIRLWQQKFLVMCKVVLFDSHEKSWVCVVMTSVWLASWMIVRCGKNFNIVIFSGTLNRINIKLCMRALLIELYLLVPVGLSVSLTIFQGHRSVKQIQLKNWYSYLVMFKLHRIAK